MPDASVTGESVMCSALPEEPAGSGGNAAVSAHARPSHAPPSQAVPARSWRRIRPAQLLVTLLVLAAGVAATLLVASALREDARATWRLQTERQVEGEARMMQQGVDGYVGSVVGVVELAQLAGPTGPNRDRFEQAAGFALSRAPGLHSILHVARVPAAERTAFERRRREAGFPGFRVWQLDVAGAKTEVTPRDSYFPVILAAPQGPGAQSIGFDFGSQPGRASALELARDLAEPVLAGRVVVETAMGSQQALRIVHPVYGSDWQIGQAQTRRDGLIGFVIGIVRIPDMLAAILPGGDDTGLDVHFVDPSAPPGARAIRRDTGATLVELPEQLALDGYSRPIALGGERWIAVFTPRPSHFSRQPPWRALLALAGGLAGTLALATYLFSSFRRHQEVEVQVGERTAALDRVNRALLLEIAERRGAEAELRATSERLSQASAAKSAFLANISHELRTPLNAIIGFSEIIQNARFEPRNADQFTRYAADIHTSATHLLGIINDLLDLSRIDAHRFTLVDDVVSVAEIVHAAARMIGPKAEAGDVLVTIDCPPGLPLVMADERALRQVFLNLLSNAVKFTAVHGEVRVTAHGDCVAGFTVAFTDTGIGIAAADIPKVLEPFGQADNSLNRRYEGSGLGLPLARRFTELHGGTLTLQSTLGHGTTVSVWLPPERVLAPGHGSGGA